MFRRRGVRSATSSVRVGRASGAFSWTNASNRAVATAVLGALVAVAAFASHVSAVADRLPTNWKALPVIVVCALLALAVAIGWPTLLDLPGRFGARLVMILGGCGAVVTVALSRGEPYLRELPLVFALAMLLTFLHELTRPAPHEKTVESLSGVVSGVIVAASASAWIAAERTPGGIGLVIAGAVALAVASAVSASRLRGWLRPIVTMAAAAVAAAIIAYVTPPDVRPLAGAVIGLAVGIGIAALDELFHRLPALKSRTAGLAAVALPVSVSGVFVYVVGRVLVG